MSFIPSSMLEKLYTRKSLQNIETGFQFELKNRLMDAKLLKVHTLTVNEKKIEPNNITLAFEDGTLVAASAINEDSPLAFGLKQSFNVIVKSEALITGNYTLIIEFEAKPFGKLTIKASDTIA